MGLVPCADYSQATPFLFWESGKNLWLSSGDWGGGHRDAGFLGEETDRQTQRDSDGETEQVKRKTMKGQGMGGAERKQETEKGKKGP